MDKITAPYGFVPLSKKVVYPQWLKTQSGEAPPIHDVPFEDGLCGTLEVEITAETPIFVRGSDGKGEEPFKLANGPYAIPGTSLRGALRNIVEIISFGHFGRVNNHRYAVRDLNNRHLYGQYMADIVKDPRTGKGEPMPLVNAGWLSRKGEGLDAIYEIEVCDFAKLEYRDLMQLARENNVRNFNPGEKQSSVDKYKKWAGKSLKVDIKVDWRRPEVVDDRRLPSRYGVAKPVRGQSKGTLVMTGQPSGQKDSKKAKHHDFVFIGRSTQDRKSVPIQTFQDFEFVHSDRGQQNKLSGSLTPNEEWGYWKPKLEKGERVPVFFLTRPDGRVDSFGLALMYRLPYKYSIHEAINNVSRDHLKADGTLDFAEGLFGTVRELKNEQGEVESTFAFKGRVGISHALAMGTPQLGSRVEAVLGSPKASYYPNYVEQRPGVNGGLPAIDGRDGKNNAVYKTWMDSDGAPRGWKRYRTLTKTSIPRPPSGADGRPLDLSKVGTRFRPLREGAKFRAQIDIHNLKPEELGGLLWAIELGGDEKARHTLGMARPLGFGRCTIKVVSADVRDMDWAKFDLATARQSFEDWITKEVPDWRNSVQIKELIALAKPVPPEQACYQKLDPGKRVNEFVDAKKDGLALLAAVPNKGATESVRAVISSASSGNVRAKVRTAVPSGVSSTSSGTVRAKVIEKTTKKGGVMFKIIGSGEEGILHPTSQKPPSLQVGTEYEFMVMAQAKPVSLKWIDPDAPPPPPPKSSGKGGPGGKPGGKSGGKFRFGR